MVTTAHGYPTDTRSVELAGIELQSPCPRCSAPVAINALTDRARCSGCLTEPPLPAFVWDEALRGVEADVVQFATGYLRHGPVWGEGGPPPGPHVTWLRGHDAPPCPRCQRPMRLWPQGTCVCGACGAVRPVLPRPGWLPPDSPVFGYVSDEPAGVPERRAEPVSVACTHCGAPLSADGSSQIVSCRHCATRVALPDAVWRSLHPPRVTRRWWLAVRVEDDPRRRPVDVSSFAQTSRSLVDRLILLTVPLFFLSLIAGHKVWSPEVGWALACGNIAVFVALLIALWFRGRWRHARICRPGNEVVGRLGRPGRFPSLTPVLITPPRRPTVLLTRVSFRDLSEKRFAELGGEGGKVRAWIVPGKPSMVYVEPTPSTLE